MISMANEELDKMIPDCREKAIAIMGRNMIDYRDFSAEDYYALRQLAKAIVDLNEKWKYTDEEIRGFAEKYHDNYLYYMENLLEKGVEKEHVEYEVHAYEVSASLYKDAKELDLHGEDVYDHVHCFLVHGDVTEIMKETGLKGTALREYLTEKSLKKSRKEPLIERVTTLDDF